MAKIGDLVVTKIKIKDGSLNTFYWANGTSGTTATLTVAEASANPTTLYGRCVSSNCIIQRDRDSKFIGSSEGFANRVAFFCFDDDPQDGDSYTMSGISNGSFWELSAVVRLK